MSQPQSQEVQDLALALRAATLGKPKEPRKETVEFNGQKYEVRQPSIVTRDRIMKDSKDDKGAQQLGRMCALAVIACTFIPGTDNRLYTDADLDGMLGQPTGSFVDTLGNVAIRLMMEAPEQAGKA